MGYLKANHDVSVNKTTKYVTNLLMSTNNKPNMRSGKLLWFLYDSTNWYTYGQHFFWLS